MIRRALVLMFALALLIASRAHADFEDGETAFRLGDYETALREFRVLAEAGDAMAQKTLGLMYIEGKGVRKNLAEAAF